MATHSDKDIIAFIIDTLTKKGEITLKSSAWKNNYSKYYYKKYLPIETWPDKEYGRYAYIRTNNPDSYVPVNDNCFRSGLNISHVINNILLSINRNYKPAYIIRPKLNFENTDLIYKNTFKKEIIYQLIVLSEMLYQCEEIKIESAAHPENTLLFSYNKTIFDPDENDDMIIRIEWTMTNIIENKKIITEEGSLFWNIFDKLVFHNYNIHDWKNKFYHNRDIALLSKKINIINKCLENFDIHEMRKELKKIADYPLCRPWINKNMILSGINEPSERRIIYG